MRSRRPAPHPTKRSTDGNQIPDSIERRLGTTVDDRDSDRDGLTDNIELFGTGTFDREAALPDGDADGAYDSSWTNVHDRTLALDYVTFENP